MSISMNRPLPGQLGDFLQSVDAPALLLDLDAFERNLSLMADASKTCRTREAFARGALW